MNIGSKIKQIRENNNLNQSEFGEKLGVSQKIISNIESAKNEPSLELLRNVINTFQISPTWLILDNNVSYTSIQNDIDFLFLETKKLAVEHKEEKKIIDYLEEYISSRKVLSKIISKLKTIKGKDFISKLKELWSGEGERILIVLYYFLIFLQKEEISINPNIKNDFINSLKLFNTPKNLLIISDKDKKRLIDWVENNLTEVEIIDILSSSSNVEEILDSIRDELNIFNKFSV